MSTSEAASAIASYPQFHSSLFKMQFCTPTVLQLSPELTKKSL